MEQRTAEWWNARSLKLTASNAYTIAVNGVGLATYCQRIIDEAKNGVKVLNNPHIQRGIELEPRAIDKYENQKIRRVSKCGFLTNDKYKQSGASPDGLVGKNGLIEVKCPNDEKYQQLLFKMKIEKCYLYQMVMQLMITGRVWCDYTVHNPNFKQSLIIKRIYAKDHKKEKAEIILGLTAGRRILKKLINN